MNFITMNAFHDELEKIADWSMSAGDIARATPEEYAALHQVSRGPTPFQGQVTKDMLQKHVAVHGAPTQIHQVGRTGTQILPAEVARSMPTTAAQVASHPAGLAEAAAKPMAGGASRAAKAVSRASGAVRGMGRGGKIGLGLGALSLAGGLGYAAG